MKLRSVTTWLFGAPLAVVFLALALTVGVAAPALAAPDARHEAVTVVRSCSNAKQVQPRDLTSIFCGDMGLYVLDITWIGWTDGWAAGYGTERRKLCKPDCATGGIASRPVGIWLFAPSRGKFTKISLYSSATAPPKTYRLTGG